LLLSLIVFVVCIYFEIKSNFQISTVDYFTFLKKSFNFGLISFVRIPPTNRILSMIDPGIKFAGWKI